MHKYTIDRFIKEYNYEFRRKGKLLKIDRLPLHKRMKHIMYYISYFLKYIYDNEIHVMYKTHTERVIDTDHASDKIEELMQVHNISFFMDDYYCIMEVGKCEENFGSLTLRLYSKECGLKTLATESITLDSDLIVSYANYLKNTANTLAKKLFSDEIAAYFIVQGINLLEVIK